ncbi:TMV resistance protein N-like [Rutidosis leptorrhynchoides]|uniref:TMV resistance protein N-like n=1 Tax=Rutidosis leptorrhynchoides TaxID=125765 RepID=UPI003A992105
MQISNTSMASSSSGSRKYHVFLSFRGEDTRKNYVDHLYKALSDKLIHTYKDDQTLPRGDSIGPSLLNAIEESQIAVVVFSENYADSSWCLDELVHIMKCRDERGLIVIPIFYKVDPSDVRKLKGQFGTGFAKPKRDKSIIKEELWKKVIVDASNISGWEPSHIANGHEAAGIKSIVDTISERLFSLDEDVDDDLVGMGTRLQSLKSLLDIESGGVHMVGIWGVGGIGKTTLAYSAYDKFSHQFQDVNVQSVEEGKNMMRRRLRRSNVLIVLDDVDKDDQIEALAGSHKWFGGGSRIIITTRDEHLLKRENVKISHASLLSHDEAFQLFNRHAVQEDKPPIEDYDTLSRRAVSYADGLPLAPKVLGSFLRGKDKKEWESALEKMKNIPNPTIMDKLKISYDGLELYERELFLDIACFHRGDLVVYVKEMLEACGLYPDIGIKVLIEKALITISKNRFEMHDLIQEMGHYIVRGLHPKNPEKHSRVWKDEEIVEICSTDSARENNEIEAIRFGYMSLGFCKLVSNMRKLRLLIVSGDRFHVHHVEGPCFLSNELQYISWKYYPRCPFPADFQPTKLVFLKLENTLQKQLWQGYKRLPQLKKLIIHNAHKLVSTPNFGGFPCLEYLKLGGCNSLEEIHPSLGNCNSLVNVFVSYCDKLRDFPNIICMQNLETLDITLCRALAEFPEIHVRMDSLKMLTISEVGIEVLPASSIGHYCTNLISLKVTNCKKLKRIEGNFQEMKQLEKFAFSGLFIHVKLLKDLFSRDCLLRKLDLSCCLLKDGEIPCDVGELFNLTLLNLSWNNFSRLPFTLLKLTHLKALNLSFCHNLLELLELPSSVDLFIGNNCNSLESIGDFYKNCKRLSQVYLSDSNSVTGAEGLLQCMLHGKAINHHMKLYVDGLEIPKTFIPPLRRGSTCRLQLPQNWYNDFCGFLMCSVLKKGSIRNQRISLKHEQSKRMGMNVEPGLWKECDEDDKYTRVVYVSFDSLRHTTWWDSNSNAVSFSVGVDIKDVCRGLGVNNKDVCRGFGVKLVARETNSVITETATDFSEYWDSDSFEFGDTNFSLFWEDKDNCTFKFKIVDDTKSTLKICY